MRPRNVPAVRTGDTPVASGGPRRPPFLGGGKTTQGLTSSAGCVAAAVGADALCHGRPSLPAPAAAVQLLLPRSAVWGPASKWDHAALVFLCQAPRFPRAAADGRVTLFFKAE